MFDFGHSVLMSGYQFILKTRPEVYSSSFSISYSVSSSVNQSICQSANRILSKSISHPGILLVPQGSSFVNQESYWATLGSSWVTLGSSWVTLGSSLLTQDSSWFTLGSSWVPLGSSWVSMGSSLVTLGSPWVILGHPWVILGHPGVILGHPGVILSHQGVILGHHGVILGHRGVTWGHPWAPMKVRQGVRANICWREPGSQGVRIEDIQLLQRRGYEEVVYTYYFLLRLCTQQNQLKVCDPGWPKGDPWVTPGWPLGNPGDPWVTYGWPRVTPIGRAIDIWSCFCLEVHHASFWVLWICLWTNTLITGGGGDKSCQYTVLYFLVWLILESSYVTLILSLNKLLNHVGL